MAALYPALRYALAHDKRLFVLTAKTLQQEMAMAVLRLLNARAPSARCACAPRPRCAPTTQVICHEEYCRYAKDYALKLQASGLVRRLLDEHPTLEPDDVFRAAQATEVCPFEVSLELLGRAQVVVCDYNYAFDPYVALPEFGADRDLSDVVLVIDEVHNLVERGRGYYSPELSARRGAAGGGGRWGAAASRSTCEIERLCLALAALIERAVRRRAGGGAAGRARGRGAAARGGASGCCGPDFDAAFVDYLEHQRTTRTFRADDPFVGLYFDVLRFLNGLVVSDDAFSHCVERRGGDSQLQVLCKDPSRFLGGVIRRTHATIGLSATLSPPEFYLDLLGFEAGRTAFVELPNPFPAENRRVVIDSTVATAWQASGRPTTSGSPSGWPRSPTRCPATAWRSSRATTSWPRWRGGCGCAASASWCSGRPTATASARRSSTPCGSAVLGDVLLLAVAGGVFAEGVDYPGDMLRGGGGRRAVPAGADASSSSSSRPTTRSASSAASSTPSWCRG